MSDQDNKFNEFAKKHGAKKEVWDENLMFKYQNRSLREYTASIYGMPFLEFPEEAFTSEPVYLRWCIKVSGMMPPDRKGQFKQFMRERLIDAEEEDIPPDTEEGAEIRAIVLTILKKELNGRCRDFDQPQENQELEPGEWVFCETVMESKCGAELFIKYEGLKARITHFIALNSLEIRPNRREVTKWLRANGRYYDKKASVNRHRCAYVLPYEMVETHKVFDYRGNF